MHADENEEEDRDSVNDCTDEHEESIGPDPMKTVRRTTDKKHPNTGLLRDERHSDCRSANGKLGCREKNQQPTQKFAGVKRHECLQGP